MFSVASKISPFVSLTKTLIDSSYLPARAYAARKGTRERKLKKKVKKDVEVKVKFIPHNQRNKEQLLAERPSLKFDDSHRSLPQDDVYAMKYYRWKVYSFEEAVQNHRETHHPDMYNLPEANLHVRIELNMQGEKSTRFVDDFNSIAPIPHKFDHGEDRTIIAFGKSVESQKEALNAGAQLAGGLDLIKQIQNGTVSLKNFQFIVAHPDILPDLVPLRGLMKRRFPSPKLGTLDVDLTAVTTRFLTGINYSAKKDEYEKDFGLVETVLGSLDMESWKLEQNFAALVRDVDKMRPKRAGDFISRLIARVGSNSDNLGVYRCLLLSPPSSEKFKVDHGLYIRSGRVTEEENEEEGERVAL